MESQKKNNKNPIEQKPQKSQRIILQQTEETALTQLERSSAGLFISGIAAGLEIGFSVLLMSVMFTAFKGVFPAPVVNLMVSNMYPLGFVFVILGRSELFTEHTTLAVLPVFQGLASIKKLIRLWVIVYFSNILGGLLFAFLLSHFATSLPQVQGWALEQISNNAVIYSWEIKILSATLAGWLMGLLAWLVAAARETISQLFIIWIITTSIGLAGLSHCIVGNIEVSAGLFSGNVSFNQYLEFLGPVTLGNTIGGVLFVAILKYSHTTYSGEEQEVDLEALAEKDRMDNG